MATKTTMTIKTTKKPAPPTNPAAPAASVTAPPIRGMIGSHCSAAGGIHNAIDEALALGLDCAQVFTKNQRQWSAPPLTDEAIRLYREAIARAGWNDLPQRVVSHNSYLVNLATPDPELRAKSIAAQRDELERCEALGIRWCVAHPGAHLGTPRAPKSPNSLRSEPSADERAGLERIARSLDEIHRSLKGVRAVTCLETTTGSGTNLGYDFRHLRIIRDLVREPERIAYCLDTCHIVSAGYDMGSDEAAEATLEEFRKVCGRDLLAVIHVNDSKAPPGSRVDRHEHIGMGTCGMACFRAIMLAPDLSLVPKILETEKADDPSGVPWDSVNAGRLRAILSPSAGPSPATTRQATGEPALPVTRKKAPAPKGAVKKNAR
ncbi:MAG: deoxyribonuclease IV [Phycisphaerae bacterium]|nr:deoxyribonuclease IV [Phycisphaerae bacterium]